MVEGEAIPEDREVSSETSLINRRRKESLNHLLTMILLKGL